MKVQSKQTGFLHMGDTVPLFENFCLAFSFFRKKTGESVREGKELIERLLHFQVEGNFPRFIHEFPACKDPHLGLKVAPLFVHILEDFQAVIDQAFKDKLGVALKKMIQKPESMRYLHRYEALCGKRPTICLCKTAQEWFEWILSDQLFEKGAAYPIPFNKTLNVFTGHHPLQNGQEPETAPIEYVLAEKQDLRLQKDHINQLYAALLYPFSSSIAEDTPFTWKDTCFLWQGLHSLLAPGARLEENRLVFDLQEGLEIGRDDVFEARVYVSKEASLSINGQKGTVFYLGDTITVATPFLTFDLQFELEGEGDFCGHISKANRPGQIENDPFEAYDWKIGLRTLRREGFCKISCLLTSR